MKSDIEFLRKLAIFENIDAESAENLHKRI